MFTRYDTAPINELSIDPNTGFLHARNVPIARVGVFPYRRADGSIEMEAKLPDDLLADETVQSANSKPITDDHPHESVNSSNSKSYMKGFTADNAHVDNDRLKVDMTITDGDLINEVKNGKQELSIGFATEVAPIKGEFDGMKYDSVQKNIQINHVAVVDRGRAGHSVSLTGDSAEMILEDEKGESMETTTVRLGGDDIQVAKEDASKVTKASSAMDDKDKQIAKLQAQIEQLSGKADGNQKNAEQAQAKADSLEKELAETKKKFEGDALDKAIAERMDAIDEIKPYVGDSFDFKGKSIRDMKLEAIKKTDSVDLADKADMYVDAYFDAMKNRKANSGVVDIKPAEHKADSAENVMPSRYNLANDLANKRAKGGNK